MLILFRCGRCFAECRGNPARDEGLVSCKSCGRQHSLKYTASIKSANTVDVCAVCQREDFYIRDEARKGLGLIYLLAGLAGAYFTYGVTALLGGWGFYWYFWRYPKLTVCYHCYSKYRNCRVNSRHMEYDLEVVNRFESEVRNERGVGSFRNFG